MLQGMEVFLALANHHPNEEFRAYGAGPYPEVVEHLEGLQKDIPNFKFMGSLPRGRPHREAFCRAKTFVMPTQQPEAFGLTIVEAMSKGVPVIGSTQGSLPELIEPADLEPGESLGISTESMSDMSRALSAEYNRTFIQSSARSRYHVNASLLQLLQHSCELLEASGGGSETTTPPTAEPTPATMKGDEL